VNCYNRKQIHVTIETLRILSSVVFCVLVVSSLPEVGSGRTVWRSPPSTVEFSHLSHYYCIFDWFVDVWTASTYSLYICNGSGSLQECRLSSCRHRASVTLRLAVYRQSVCLGDKPIDTYDQKFFQLSTCFHSPHVTSSLTTEWVCSLQLLRVLASAFIIRSDSCGTYDHIILSQIRDSLNPEG
jgi:hypothetical protein